MIIICTPAKDTVHAGFTFDLVQLIQKTPDTYFAVSLGSLLPNQRTELVRKVFDAHASHILFIDNDMRFPPDTAQRLLSHKKDIVGINCPQTRANKLALKTSKKKGLEKVKVIGFGVTLIRTEVFLKVQEPWFATPYDGMRFVGEDLFFSRKAREAGYTIYVDHDLSKEIRHCGTYEYKI